MLMQSNGPSPAPPPATMPSGNGQNPYDFILKGEGKPKRTLGGGSLKQRIIIVGGGVLILLIIAIIFVSFLGSTSKGSSDALVKVAQEQTELARVAAIGVAKANSSETKNLAIITQLSMESSQADTVALLKKGGHKVSDKTLALLQDPNTDQQLDAADAGNSFDATFTDLLHKQLNSYRASLQSAFKTASTTQQQLLQTSFNDATVLIGPTKT